MNEPGPRYIYAGHAIGAAAQFHKLDEVENLNHVVPTLGASVLPVTGGLSQSHVTNYCFSVDHPRKRTLLAVRRIETTASGKESRGIFETDVRAEIESVSVVDKLHIDFVQLHLLSSRDPNKEDAVLSTRGNKIEGVRLGKVEAKIHLDEEPLSACGSREQLADFYRKQSAEYRRENCWRFGAGPDDAELKERNGQITVTLVRKIELIGEDPAITVSGNMIRWVGFGRIFVAEVIVKHNDRRLTMVRLAMGSDAGGPGTVGDGHSNGAIGT